MNFAAPSSPDGGNGESGSSGSGTESGSGSYSSGSSGAPEACPFLDAFAEVLHQTQQMVIAATAHPPAEALVVEHVGQLEAAIDKASILFIYYI